MDLRLLVEAQHHRVCQRIQSDDVVYLVLGRRISRKRKRLTPQ